MKNNLQILATLFVIYLTLKFVIPFWNYLIYPINLLVTFMHEFWHSFFAILTGWNVIGIEINWNGSWFARISWWIKSIVLMGWYIWSAIFWNILLYIWTKKQNLSEIVIYFLSWLLVFTGIFWYNSFFSSLLLFVLAALLFLLAKKSKFDSIILQFLWISSILYIIEDFNGGPSSDLNKFSEIFVIIPQSVWMIVWLIIVLIITWINLKLIFKK